MDIHLVNCSYIPAETKCPSQAAGHFQCQLSQGPAWYISLCVMSVTITILIFYAQVFSTGFKISNQLSGKSPTEKAEYNKRKS